mmetsp:Transcript_7220/g.9386  ORF Transcript_7220/g.9386 Transcript_7220/m.9386 type:complete len:86 (+) Transcript_7220:299-556(+)
MSDSVCRECYSLTAVVDIPTGTGITWNHFTPETTFLSCQDLVGVYSDSGFGRFNWCRGIKIVNHWLQDHFGAVDDGLHSAMMQQE